MKEKIMRISALLALTLLGLFVLFQEPAFASGPLQVRITQVDASRFPEVTVYVSVTDASGEPVGIDPKNITLSENGAAMKIESTRGVGVSASNENEAVTTLLVMDVSGSMNEAGKLDAAKSAARAYVNQLRPGDQAGLLTFNTQINYVVPVTADHATVLNAIDTVQAGDFTAMYDALARAVETLNPIPGRNAIITLTDGLDNRSTNKADQVIEKIGPRGVTISTIGLGEPSQGTASMAGIDEAALKSLADRAGGHYGYVRDADALKKLYERFGRTLQNEHALTYVSPAKLRDGLNRALTVSLTSTAGSPLTTAGKYNPGGVAPEVAKTAPWEIFFGAFALLIALLLLPRLITRAGGLIGGIKPSRGRVRLVRASHARFSERVGNAFHNLFGGLGKKKPAHMRAPNPSASRVRVK